MLETFIVAGVVSYFVGQVKLPPCIIGKENSNYCVSRQYANVRYENIEFAKKLNTNPNDTRIIIKLKDKGTVVVPYDPNKFTIEYSLSF